MSDGYTSCVQSGDGQRRDWIAAHPLLQPKACKCFEKEENTNDVTDQKKKTLQGVGMPYAVASFVASLRDRIEYIWACTVCRG